MLGPIIKFMNRKKKEKRKVKKEWKIVTCTLAKMSYPSILGISLTLRVASNDLLSLLDKSCQVKCIKHFFFFFAFLSPSAMSQWKYCEMNVCVVYTWIHSVSLFNGKPYCVCHCAQFCTQSLQCVRWADSRIL